TGIAPETGKLIRPLLFATRAEILEYARIHEITWYEDSSNASDDYARNFVRHHVFPRLEELNPNFLRTAERNIDRIGEAEDNLAFLLNNWLQMDRQASNQAANSTTLSIQKQKLTQLPSPKQALRQLLKPYGFDAEQARQLAESIDHIGLELNSEKGWKLLNDRTEILLRHKDQSDPDSGSPGENHLSPILIQEDDLMVSLPDGSRIFLMPVTNPQSTTHQSTHHQSTHHHLADHQSITVDADQLKFPLHLRHWQAGDSFQPLGMEGKSQKLQDFFTNQKLTRFEKEEVWLLVNGDGTVIWLLGLRMDERFKIHTNTIKALKFNWIK
ncbi:MAG: tRNA lysidine(34) synthetase TilS, partial [Saprospiraceae bacterium]|nr:tRNA lysidine(34) synthetase TilS [Saprospiraceae bacterium]